MNEPEPGPWMVETLRDEEIAERYWVVAPPQHGGKYGLVIATDVGGQTQDQAKVHAHILAAANDMLEALRGAMEENEWKGNGEWELPSGHWMVKARAAIAKAEGGNA